MRLSRCFLLTILATATSLSGQSIFLQVPSLSCATAAGSNAFPVLSWTFLVSQTTSTSSSGGGTSPTLNFANLSVTKNFDECSAAFLKSSANAQPIPTVTITQNGQNRLPQVIVQMTNATVTADDSSSANGGVIQTISFSYQKICITNAAAGSSYCYDLILGRSAIPAVRR